ncbi:claudin-4 [Austrofundulus limnaeus]|uniref:Claudin n=1 Tax=Austrofundulus limnaeus TaxID=52670 RepID=A0A2I4CXI8_AUSLI|nr:PREDICTED: claudin-4-like [Austrofundulus limnaeus]
MGKIAKEVSGQIISFVGLCLASVTCGVPMWRVTTYIGANIVTGQVIWDGLWMRCVMQATGQMQCTMANNVMSMSQDLQASRALVIICLIVGLIGFLVTFIGAKCTSCLKTEWGSANAVICGGVLIILAAILVLIPVCWSAAITISDYGSSSLTETQKRELGASIYIGWAAAAVLLIGGIILTTSCPPRQKFYPNYPVGPMYPYAPARYTGPVYAPPSSQPYTSSGSYVPNKPYAAPATYSPRQYI